MSEATVCENVGFGGGSSILCVYIYIYIYDLLWVINHSLPGPRTSYPKKAPRHAAGTAQPPGALAAKRTPGLGEGAGQEPTKIVKKWWKNGGRGGTMEC